MSSLTVPSPSNVSLEYQLATIGERVLAFMIDTAVIAITAMMLTGTIGKSLGNFIGDDYFYSLFLYAFFPMLLLLSYFALAEYLFEGQSLGKRALGLRTVRIDGAPPTFEAFGLRTAMLILDFMLSSGAIALLAMGSSPNRQRIGDRIAQTVVVRIRPKALYELSDILNIKTTDDHIVVYPRAVELSVEQALTIKELIVRWEQERSQAIAELVKLTVNRLRDSLGTADVRSGEQVEFLRQVLRDYIVLTR